MPDIEETLASRQPIYGDFPANARIAQDLKYVMHASPNWGIAYMPPQMMEALEVIAQKISRILSGDPYYVDNWHDISGYATLVVKELERGSTCPKS
jgi:hypothetical protein